MNASKLIAILFTLCLTLVSSAIIAGMTHPETARMANGNSKLAVKNMVAPKTGPYQSVTATPSIILTARAVREQTERDIAATASAIVLPVEPTLAPVPALAEAPAVAADTVEPISVAIPTVRATQVALMSASELPADAKAALLLLIGRQHKLPRQRVRTNSSGPEGSTEHVFETSAIDRWRDIKTIDGNVVEVVQFGGTHYHRDGAKSWVVAIESNPLLDAEDRESDAISSADLLVTNVVLEGDYQLNNRTTLLYYYAFNNHGAGTARIWIDKSSLVPVRSEIALADGSLVVTEYEYGDQIDVAAPLISGW